jgi:hypothetical protein
MSNYRKLKLLTLVFHLTSFFLISLMAIPVSIIETEALLRHSFWESPIKKIHNAQRMHVEELGNVTHSYGRQTLFQKRTLIWTISTSSRNIKCLHKQLQYLHKVTIIQYNNTEWGFPQGTCMASLIPTWCSSHIQSRYITLISASDSLTWNLQTNRPIRHSVLQHAYSVYKTLLNVKAVITKIHYEVILLKHYLWNRWQFA